MNHQRIPAERSRWKHVQPLGEVLWPIPRGANDEVPLG